MNNKQLTNTLVDVACSLAHIEQEMQMLKNRVNQLVDTQRQTPVSSVATTDSVTHTYRLGIIDRQLRELQKFLIQQGQALTIELEAELANPTSSLADFEIETQLHYVLAKDDPQYDEEDDNILTSRTQFRAATSNELPLEDQLLEIDTQNFADSPNHPMPQQGWLSHDVMEHDLGIDSPAIGPRGLLRIGKVWVEVIAKRQYRLNLKTGLFEK
jgi:hypothetical protein